MDTFSTRSYKPQIIKIVRWLAVLVISLVIISIFFVLLFRWVNPPTSSYILQQQLGSKNDSSAITHRWADWEEISDYLKVAAITSEDQRFPFHNGFDFEAIQDALEEQKNGQELRGASTITQQTAKNLFLWPGRSYIRKGLEAYLTVFIELFWPKRRILEVYLNIAEFGPGVFGVEAAAHTYFNTSADSLNMQQSALMITALPSPKRYNLGDPSPYMIERRNWILRYMFLLGNTNYLDNIQGNGVAKN